MTKACTYVTPPQSRNRTFSLFQRALLALCIIFPQLPNPYPVQFICPRIFFTQINNYMLFASAFFCLMSIDSSIFLCLSIFIHLSCQKFPIYDHISVFNLPACWWHLDCFLFSTIINKVDIYKSCTSLFYGHMFLFLIFI